MRTRILFITIFSLLTVLLLSGCSGLSNIDYNNQIVDHINATLDDMEDTIDVYYVSVPDIVYPDSIIDLEAMSSSYAAAESDISAIQNDLLTLESRDKTQEEAVKAGLTDYWLSASGYLETYNEMIDYYSGNFEDDLDRISELDDALYEEYNEYVDVHNELVDILATH